MPETKYQRLTRARSRSSFGAVSVSRSSLWLAQDHLLGIDSSGYTETYKRFYFRDIQALTVVATKRRTAVNAVLLVPITLCLAGVAFNLSPPSRDDGSILMVFLALTAIFVVPLLLNNLLGPTCTCYLRTAVQIEELSSLSRMRRARKVLDRVRPFIIAAQGELPPEEISARMQSAAGAPAGNAPAPGGDALPPPAADNPHAPPASS